LQVASVGLLIGIYEDARTDQEALNVGRRFSDLSFSGNQPLKSPDDQYIGILKEA
jgi:hypothetical protein